MNAEWRRAYMKVYQAAHREQIREKDKIPGRIRSRKWAAANPEVGRAWAAAHQKQRRDSIDRWKAKNPEAIKAHIIVRTAIRSGRLINPGTCSKCGRSDQPVEGHHYDYTKPLELTWTCHRCHKKIHWKKEGENHE